jgi:hypothetical protein
MKKTQIPYEVDCGMVKNGKGVVSVVVSNFIVARVGNESENGINLRSGKKAALTLAAERLKELAARMEEEARNV